MALVVIVFTYGFSWAYSSFPRTLMVIGLALVLILLIAGLTGSLVDYGCHDTDWGEVGPDC
jgi:hypothetical protein